MSPEIQTLLSLLFVAVAAVWLLRRTFGKNARRGGGGGCSSGECGALNPSVKELKRKLRQHT